MNPNPNIVNRGNIPMDVSYNSLKECIIKVGYLKKLGGKGISKNWRKRFFVLTKFGILYYFKHRTSSIPVGALNLEKYTKIYRDVNKKKNFMLINENDSSQRVFHLVSDTDEEMKEWIEDITNFFQSDVSDLQNQLNDLKLKKQDTISRKTGTKAAKKVEEYELDRLQLVLRGGRLSISVRSESPDIPTLLTITSNSDSSTTQSSQPDTQLDVNQTPNETTTTITTETSTSTNTENTENATIGFHDDDDDDDDECDE